MKPTMFIMCVLVLMTVAASSTYSKVDLMDKSVPDLVKIMREKEIDEDQIDLVLASSGSVKDEIIALLTKDQLADLQKMKIGGLRKRAISLGINDVKIEEALDADDAKAALIELIRTTAPQATTQTPTTQKSEAPSGGWVKPKPSFRPAKMAPGKRYNPGKQGSAQALLNYAVWFVNTTRQGPRGSTDLVEEALEKGADINFQSPANNGMTAVMQACSGGAASEVVELLIDKGADISIRDFNGFSMIDSAVAGARTDILDKLLGMRQTDLNILGKDGYAPIHRMLMGRSPRFLEVLSALLSAGVSPSLKSEQGLPPIALAQYADTRLLLIKAGACMPQWYKKMVDNGESERKPQSDGGYEFCEEEPLCQKVPEISGQGVLGFKFNKEKTLEEIGKFNAPMFITERVLKDICPCSTDSWIAPEMCSHAESEEEYNHLVSEFKRWEDPKNGGVPTTRAIPPEGLVEFQEKIQRRNPQLYAQKDTRSHKPSRFQMEQARKGRK